METNKYFILKLSLIMLWYLLIFPSHYIILNFEKLTDTVDPLIPIGVWGKVGPIVSYSGRPCPNRVPFTLLAIALRKQKGKENCYFIALKGR